MTKALLEQEGLDKIKTDFRYLISLFKEMLIAAGERELAQILPFDSQGMPVNNGVASEKLTQAIGICFELLNVAEENAAGRIKV